MGFFGPLNPLEPLNWSTGCSNEEGIFVRPQPMNVNLSKNGQLQSEHLDDGESS